MATAVIKINGVAGSNDDLPINVLVQLDNQNAGGELTFSWSILDQPPGAVDSLSATNIQNPTFTPQKEGTYLIKLTVNQTLITEVSQTKIAAVRFLKTRERVAAAGETIENGARGWASATERLLTKVDAEASDSGTQVGVVSTGAPAVAVGDVLRASATETIKVGLPGQEVLAGWQTTNALLLASVDQMLAVCIGAVDGSAGPYAPGKLIRVRIFGLYTGLVGVPVLGDPVYISDTGTIVLVPGTVTRQIGNVTRVGGGTYDIWVDGTFSPAGNLTSTAPVDVTKAAASAGVGTTGARHDHKHNIATAAAVAVSSSTANAEGAASSLARSDHTHNATVTVSADISIAAQTAAGVVDTLITGATSTPGAGTYLVSHEGEINVTNQNSDIEFSIFANAAVVTGSRRRMGFESIDNPNMIFHHSSIVTVAAAQAIEARWSRVGGGATMQLNQANTGRFRLIRLS